ncbi:hypothetical protein H2201_000953 [Coniosporium apollinis]|uniref:Lanthionine synthetase C-like protein 1 n=2 Tax=Coniosporium TaxID=2810619 RepID=A0ABQ9P9S4_9PEZI|nr:hypothetical protein H2199_001477 [Cladosporium sp. JES 115]KAJ9669127.1 hypothetical protein H2201_000953 [Coniosporium apollinis]
MAEPSQRRPRYFRNDAPLSRRDPYKQLTASLTRLVNEYPPDKIPPGGGLYYGPISVAYLFFVLQRHYEELTIGDFPLGTWSAAYLELAQAHMKEYPGPKISRCGISDDIMALLAIGAASAKDADMVTELCNYAAVTTDEDASNEWLYGRAGYLYLLRLAKASFPDDEKVLDMIDDTADEVIEAIMESPRPWKWHGKAYVGAVHGAIGIITQIVLTDPTWAPKLEADLGALLSYQFESGNWPSSIPPGRDRLVQFCHGAPGVVASLLSIKEHFPNLKARIDKAIEKGRECILERGLLTKEPCLCHGISGNALALDDKEFEHFLTYTTGHEIKSLEKDGMLEKSDDPSSLWCGEAGRAWTWAVADKGLDKLFLGYNDI